MKSSVETGFSLLELTATMAVFALVAVMGLQALAGSLRVSDRLTTYDKQTWEIAMALAMLRRDLATIAPIAFAHPSGVEEPAFLADPSRLSMSQAGLAVMPGTLETGQSRTSWRFDPANGTLVRQSWLSLSPLNMRSAGPDRIVLSNVAEVDIRILTENGWQDQFGTNAALTVLPKAVQISVTTETFGVVSVMEAL